MFGGRGGGRRRHPPPRAAGQVLTSPYPGATLVGGAGADTLIASQGPDHLTGGPGPTTSSSARLPWSAGHITDFTPGSDMLDLRGLFAAIGYHGTDLVADGTLSFVSDGAGDTRVVVKTASSPWPTLVTTLDHVDPTALHSGDWLFHSTADENAGRLTPGVDRSGGDGLRRVAAAERRAGEAEPQDHQGPGSWLRHRDAGAVEGHRPHVRVVVGVEDAGVERSARH